jgi:hypothetical protein
MKKIAVPFIGLCIGLSTMAQPISPTDLKDLKKREDSLKKSGYELVNAKDAAQRFRADSVFVKMLVRALKVKNSFRFPLICTRQCFPFIYLAGGNG